MSPHILTDQGLRRAEDRADESPHVYVFNVGVRLGPMIVFRVQKGWVALSKKVKTGVYPPKNPIRPTIWHGLSSSYEFHVHEELRKSREMRPDGGSFGRARRSYSSFFTFSLLELLLSSCMILIMAAMWKVVEKISLASFLSDGGESVTAFHVVRPFWRAT